MKKIVLITCFIISWTLLVGQNKVNRSYQLEPFDAINASFVYDIEIFKGNEYTLELEIPAELAEELEIKVNENVLNLGISME